MRVPIYVCFIGLGTMLPLVLSLYMGNSMVAHLMVHIEADDRTAVQRRGHLACWCRLAGWPPNAPQEARPTAGAD